MMAKATMYFEQQYRDGVWFNRLTWVRNDKGSNQFQQIAVEDQTPTKGEPTADLKAFALRMLNAHGVATDDIEIIDGTAPKVGLHA